MGCRSLAYQEEMALSQAAPANPLRRYSHSAAKDILIISISIKK